MAYTDPQFTVQATKLLNPVTGTATASATNGTNVTVQLYSPTRKLDVNKLRLVVAVVPKTGAMALIVNIMNGTNTVGSATMGTNTTAGSFIDATLVTSNTRVNADSVLTAVVTGSATASADTIGTMLVELDHTPVFV
jgi:hypothetical protein